MDINTHPEIVLGLVGPLGTDLTRVARSLEQHLKAIGYENVRTIRLTSLMEELRPYAKLPRSPHDDHVSAYMDAGNDFRRRTARGSAMALLGVARIREERKKITKSENRTAGGTAYILQSLKHVEELQELRSTYGERFLLVAAYSPRNVRRVAVARKIAHTRGGRQYEKFLPNADGLILRDEQEQDNPYGQQVRDVFPEADVFFDVADESALDPASKRFIEILYGHPFHTPSQQEYGMFLASAAALRSASPARQVGAAIANGTGDLVALGCNEVPKCGGGCYWPGDVGDRRDFHDLQDVSDRMRQLLVTDVLTRLQSAGLLNRDLQRTRADQLLGKVLQKDGGGPLRRAEVLNVIEYGRAVHAEMVALMDAARRGVSVDGCVLYTTTFPCHDCAKHIVAAGISKVVFIEPYPKSLASDFYSDSISVEPTNTSDSHVPFEAFVGVSPRRYQRAFAMENRKKADGSLVQWDADQARFRFGASTISYLQQEQLMVERFEDICKEAKIKIGDGEKREKR